MKSVCYENWEQLPASANKLFSTGARHSFFFSRPWLENLVDKALPPDQSLRLVCVVDGNEVLAMLPLMYSERMGYSALTHLYSSLYTVLISDRNRAEILHYLVQGLKDLPVPLLRMGPLAEDDQNMELLQAALETSGYQCYRHFRFFNWVHRPQGQSFDDYLASRPGRVRNTIARKQRKLEREQDYCIRLFRSQDLPKGLADYHAVYQSSWKAHEQFHHVVNGMAHCLAVEDWLRLAVLYINGKPAAAQFWIVAHGKASIFRLAHDEAWRHYSPGSILISYLMQQVIDIDRVDEIDFLTGNDAYKQDWMSERRTRWALYCARRYKVRRGINQFFGRLNRFIVRA